MYKYTMEIHTFSFFASSYFFSLFRSVSYFSPRRKHHARNRVFGKCCCSCVLLLCCCCWQDLIDHDGARKLSGFLFFFASVALYQHMAKCCSLLSYEGMHTVKAREKCIVYYMGILVATAKCSKISCREIKLHGAKM